MGKMYLSKRKWLNPVGHYNTGAVAYSVQQDYGISAQLELWDCGRKVTLDLSVHDEKSAKQVADKIGILQTALQEIREALGKAYLDRLESLEGDDDLSTDEDYLSLIEE